MPLLRIMLAFALLSLAAQTEAKSKVPPVLAACAAFAPDGASATATASEDSLTLSLKSSSGKEATLALRLRYRGDQWQLDRPEIRWRLYDCSLFFSHDSELLAVGMTTGIPEPQKLQMAVADLRTSRWLSDFGVERAHEPNGSVKLAGFLQDTSSIAVTEAWHTNETESVNVFVFDARGRQLSAQPIVHSWPEILLPFYSDAANSRLWLLHCVSVSAVPAKQPSCPISVTSLVGDGKFSAAFDPSRYAKARTDLWMLPRAFAAPDPNTILIAENDTVWRVDIQSQLLDRFVLPRRHHFWNSSDMRDGTLSPDGNVLAVLLGQYKLAFPYLADNYVYEGDDIVVLSVKPLRLLGIVPHNGVKWTRGLAVDHRNGKTTVLAYRQDHWEGHDFNKPEP